MSFTPSLLETFAQIGADMRGMRISVTDFGAATTNTGAENDVAFVAALAALDAAGGGTLYVPRGRFYLATTLSVGFSNFTLAGDGKTATILDFEDAAVVGLDVQTVLDFVLEGFSVLNTTGNGIQIGVTAGPNANAAWFRITDVATNFNDLDGFHFGDCFMGNIESIRSQNAGQDAISLAGGFQTSLNFSNCHAMDATRHGWNIKNTVYSNLDSCGADRSGGHGYLIQNAHTLEIVAGAEDSAFAAIGFYHDTLSTDLALGCRGVRISMFEKDNNSGAAHAALAHFDCNLGSGDCGDVSFDGCAHYNTPAGDALKIDAGNWRISMPRTTNQVKRAVTGGSFSVIGDGATDINNGLPVNVTGANTPIADLRPKLTNGVAAYGGRLTVYATNNNLGSSARSAVYELLLCKAVGTSSITLIASDGNTAGSTADSASFTFALDAVNDQLEVSPVGSTATGNWYFHIAATGNIDVQPL